MRCDVRCSPAQCRPAPSRSPNKDPNVVECKSWLLSVLTCIDGREIERKSRVSNQEEDKNEAQMNPICKMQHVQATKVTIDGFGVEGDDGIAGDKIILSAFRQVLVIEFIIIPLLLSLSSHCAGTMKESPRCSEVDCAINRSSGDWYSSDSKTVPPKVGTSLPSTSATNGDITLVLTMLGCYNWNISGSILLILFLFLLLDTCQ